MSPEGYGKLFALFRTYTGRDPTEIEKKDATVQLSSLPQDLPKAARMRSFEQIVDKELKSGPNNRIAKELQDLWAALAPPLAPAPAAKETPAAKKLEKDEEDEDSSIVEFKSRKRPERKGEDQLSKKDSSKKNKKKNED
jgi:hypothetical protein